MKNIFRYGALGLLFLALGCDKDEVETLSLTVSLPKESYRIGETVRFYLQGEANFIEFFAGTPVIATSPLAPANTASRYRYWNRGQVDGKCRLQVNINKTANATADGSLKILISTDFKSDYTLAGVSDATWVELAPDVSTPLPTGANTTAKTCRFWLDEQYNGKTATIAFKYTSAPGTNGGWQLGSNTLANIYTDPDVSNAEDNVTYNIYANGGEMKMGRVSNKTDNNGNMTNLWTVGNTSNVTVNNPAGGTTTETWAIISTFNPSTVAPDKGVRVKGYTDIVPEFIEQTYGKAGTFTATIVARNATVYGERVDVINVDVEIVN